MHLAAGLVLVIAYLALSINSYLETQALGRFSLGYGRLGPTEARLALIALLAAVALGVEVSVLGLTLLDVVALGGAARDGAGARRAGGREPARAGRARALRRAVALGAAGPPPRTRRACGRTGRRARSPITIDCSSAMISAGDALVVERRSGPSACCRADLVEVVEDVRREREQDAEEADEDLRRWPCRARGRGRRAAGASGSGAAGATSTGGPAAAKRQVLEHVDERVLERGLVERRDVPDPHRRRRRRRRRTPDARTAPPRARSAGCGAWRAAGCAWSARASGRSATRSAISRCWTMCADASCSPSRSIGETSATNRQHDAR